MSPAPVRGNPTRGRVVASGGRPPTGGYGLVLGLFLVGLACFIAAGALAAQSLASSADDLARNAARGDFRAVLDQGVNYVYSEDGVRLGPLDVRIIGPDGNELAARATDEVITYDVDARNGRADLVVDVPSTDAYSIELVGDVRNIAVGGKVAEQATTPSVLLLIAGALAWMIALAKLIITAVRHARWKAQGLAAGRIGDLRGQLAEQVEGTEAQPGLAQRVQSQAQSAVDQARSRVDQATGSFNQSWSNSSQHVGRPPVYSDASELAQGNVQAGMDRLQDTVASGEITDERVNRVAGRADGVLASVQERLERGESLRDIAMGARQDVRAEFTQEAEITRQDADEIARAARSELTQPRETASGASDQVQQTLAQQASEAADALQETVRAQVVQAADAVTDTARLQGHQATAAVAETVEAVVPSWSSGAAPTAAAVAGASAAAVAATDLSPAPPVADPPNPVPSARAVDASPSAPDRDVPQASRHLAEPMPLHVRDINVRPTPSGSPVGQPSSLPAAPPMPVPASLAGPAPSPQPADGAGVAVPSPSADEAPAAKPTASPGLSPPPNYGAMRLGNSAPKPTAATESVAGISQPVNFGPADDGSGSSDGLMTPQPLQLNVAGLEPAEDSDITPP